MFFPCDVLVGNTANNAGKNLYLASLEHIFINIFLASDENFDHL